MSDELIFAFTLVANGTVAPPPDPGITRTQVMAIAAVCALGVLLLSNVVPRYVEARRRLHRVSEFEARFSAFIGGRRAEREWLATRRVEMQRDAELVGQGVVHIAPPAAMGWVISASPDFQ